MLFKSLVTRLLILPTRFASLSFSSFFEGSAAFFGFASPGKVEIVEDVEGSEATKVEVSETDDGSPFVDSVGVSSDSGVITPSAMLSAFVEAVLATDCNSDVSGASAMNRMRKQCSKTSCLTRMLVSARTLVEMKMYRCQQMDWSIGPQNSQRIQTQGFMRWSAPPDSRYL